jgi:BirA family biotin operon repressor/biotin-[acetyl-CoA-carboxylase] ligase
MDDLIGLSTRLEATIARLEAKWVRHVMVVRETGSTQDFAKSMSAGAPGLLVIAGRQTQGRGRLGRRWVDTSNLGLAMTFVVEAKRGPERLAVAAGVAACRAVDECMNGKGSVGLRWPNDVVERTADGGPGRKIAGVLIEQDAGLAYVGIGINVLQARRNWPKELAPHVTSLRELGSLANRPLVAERLLIEVEGALGADPAELAAEWTRNDLLVGRIAAFEHDGETFRGTVERIEPTSQIVLKTDAGKVRLPALTTSIVKE